jgi:hypothetical protein
MMKVLLFGITCFTTLIALPGCAPFKPTDSRAAVCNEINSRIIFNGSTQDTRRANIQNAEEPLQARAYERNNCDTTSH